MNSFEKSLEESLAFGTSSYMALDELRMLYYGRRDLYVSFTDQGDYQIQQSGRELDRPDSILCYPINDVVGRKVSTSEFYANVFRANKSGGEFIDNITHYSRDQLSNDIELIRTFRYINESIQEDIIQTALSDRRTRRNFEKLWEITEFTAKERGSSFGTQWRRILMDLGYTGMADPSSTGLFTGQRVPAVIYLDYTRREDLDIVPIQRHRQDPRKRVRDAVERKVRRMSTRRNRVAKRRIDPSTRNVQQRGITSQDVINIFRGLS